MESIVKDAFDGEDKPSAMNCDVANRRMCHLMGRQPQGVGAGESELTTGGKTPVTLRDMSGTSRGFLRLSALTRWG